MLTRGSTDNLPVFTAGSGRLQVWLEEAVMGGDLVIFVFNAAAHIGAVALAEVDPSSGRAWGSVLSSVGHREDTLAHKLALKIAGALGRRVCVIAGIHIDSITAAEIDAVQAAAYEAADCYLAYARSAQQTDTRSPAD